VACVDVPPERVAPIRRRRLTSVFPAHSRRSRRFLPASKHFSRPIGTERKKSASFEREDGASRRISGSDGGPGAHTERSRRTAIFCVEQRMRIGMWGEVGRSAAAAGQRVLRVHVSRFGPPPNGSFRLRCCRNRMTSVHSQGSSVSRRQNWIRAWDSGEPATSHSAAQAIECAALACSRVG
jgi:hypothetical protein